MDNATANILTSLNTTFYQNQNVSFSETRTAPWPGWQKCLDIVWPHIKKNNAATFSVFDLACGNMRFEIFLHEQLPESAISFFAVDNCDGLIPSSCAAHEEMSAAHGMTYRRISLWDSAQKDTFDVHYQNLDIITTLQESNTLSKHIAAPLCQLSVAFGFMHHIPQERRRQEILRDLIRQTQQRGYVIVSLWQFMKNPALARAAHTTHARALEELEIPPLDENDYLLGWKNTAHTYRYCHHFSEEEVDRLVQSVARETRLVARFVSDGRTDNLNTYLIFEVI